MMKKDFSENIEYQGCFGDHGYFLPETRNSKYYNLGKEGKVIDLPIPTSLLTGKNPRTRFYNYLDGPARIIPSIEVLRPGEKDPTTLPLESALNRCYKKAVEQGKPYFGLQNGGACMATRDPSILKQHKLSEKECKTCTKICGSRSHPCGKGCQSNRTEGKKRKGCKKKFNSTCQKGSDKANNSTSRAGGFFTNSVYKIKNMENEDEEDVDDEKGDPFSEFVMPSPEVGDSMDCKKLEKGELFDLSPSQKFGQHYFTPDSTEKGIGLFASAGAGKSCFALNIAGNFFSEWRVLWITRKGLVSVPRSELYNNICIKSLREIVDSDEKEITYSNSTQAPFGKGRKNKIDAIQSQAAKVLLKNRYGFGFQNREIMSYDTLARVISGTGTQADRETYNIFTDNPNNDFGYKTLFIIDEAHNLNSEALTVDEREFLSETVYPEVTLSGKKYRRKEDVYGDLIDTGELRGRDLIAAMLRRSYEVSGKDSAKTLLLTATPTKLFWLMNLLIPKTSDLLSLKFSDYYDPFTMQLKDESVVKFAKAVQGKISYLNLTNDPSKFSRKLFSKVHRIPIHPFHRLIFDDKLTGVDLSKTSELVAFYRNLSLCAQITGPVFSAEQIDTFETEDKWSREWSKEEDVRRQENEYEETVDKAREIFNLAVKTSDKVTYEKKKERYMKWKGKMDIYQKRTKDWVKRSRMIRRGRPVEGTIAPSEPVVPKSLDNMLDSNGKIVPFEAWRAVALPVNSDISYADPTIQEHVILKRVYDEKVEIFRRYDVGVGRGLPEEVKGILDEHGMLVGFQKYFVTTEKVRISKKAVKQYEYLLEDFRSYRRNLVEWEETIENRKSWEEMGASTVSLGKELKKPVLPTTIQSVVDEKFQLRPLEEWFYNEIYPKRHLKPDRKIKKKESSYEKYLIRDTRTGSLRIKTKEEFVHILRPEPSLRGPPADKKFSFLAWHAKFDASKARKLMPYYCPTIFGMIQNILSIEKTMKAQLGHGTKHTVFTFSVAEKGSNINYGAKLLMSAFAAFPETFELVVTYKKERVPVPRPVLVTSHKRKDTLGVSSLSSKPIQAGKFADWQGSEEKKEYERVEFNSGIQQATVDAFNAKNNVFGEKIKILIMDGAYTEGVSAFDVGVTHLLSPGLSKSELQQAVARSSRFCGSTNLPFFQGIGAFMQIHFYELYDFERQQSLYSEMLSKISSETKIDMNMTEVFNKLAADFSIDNRLNQQVHSYDPVVQGKILGFKGTDYVMRIKLKRKGEDKDLLGDIITPPEYVKGEWKKGDVVENPSHVEMDNLSTSGVILSVNEKDKFRINYNGTILTEDGRDLRHPEGTSPGFRIPNGVDVAQKKLDIANFSAFSPNKNDNAFFETVRVPDVALGSISTSFRNNTKYIVLGLISILSMLVKTGGFGVPVNIVLPEDGFYMTAPDLRDFSMQWKCDEKGVRKLTVSDKAIESFLSPVQGISMMILSLHNSACGENVENSGNSNVNLLVYVPQWKTIERFDPNGRNFHMFDSTQLDTRLYERFYTFDPTLRYMSLGETSPLNGLHTLQKMEKHASRKGVGKNKDPSKAMSSSSFGSAFVLLYIHTRLSYMISLEKDDSKESDSALVYPIRFQRSLVDALEYKFKNKLSEFVIAYANTLTTAREVVETSPSWDDGLPFWSNAVIFLKQLSSEMETLRPKPKKSQPDHKIWNGLSDLQNVIKQLF
jgi:hypothetical protein